MLRPSDTFGSHALRLNILGLIVLCLGTAMILISHTSADNSGKAGNVTEFRVVAEAADGTNWLLNGRNFEAQHFSPLKQINDQNVAGLGLAWNLDFDSAMGIVSEPIVVDGVAYVSAPQSKVYAVDAATGKLIWKFDPKVRLNQALNGSYSARTNAGVAVWEGKVFVGTGDCRLVAIDAATGKQVWESQVCEPTQTGITNAPHVAKGMAFMGYNGSDDGVRGSIAAYDANTGKERWRFWTVPGDPKKPFESKALKEIAAKTWPAGDAWKMGGADVWTAITYDPVTDFVIFGTAGAGADYGELSALRAQGDKLFAGCIVAVKAETGEYVWHYQTSSPGLQTENNHIVMADLPINGEKRHVAMTVPKHGFYYELDAWTGKLLSAKPIVKVSWATSVDLTTGKAVEVPASAGGGKQWTVHNWWPMSYNPGTGLVYIPATDRKPNTHAEVETGEWMNETEGKLIAWDPVNQSERWSVEEEIATNGGVLSTAGNLVFQGQGQRRVRGLHRRQRKKSLVNRYWLGNRVDSGDLYRERRAVRACTRWDGAQVRGCSLPPGRWPLHGRSEVRRVCWRSSWAVTFPSPRRGHRASGAEASKADCRRRHDSGRREALQDVLLRRLSLS